MPQDINYSETTVFLNSQEIPPSLNFLGLNTPVLTSVVETRNVSPFLFAYFSLFARFWNNLSLPNHFILVATKTFMFLSTEKSFEQDQV